MDLNDFNCNCLNKLLENISKEQKSVSLLGGFNVNLLNYIFGNIPSNKSNIYERDWSKFDRENFVLDYFSVDWEDL